MTWVIDGAMILLAELDRAVVVKTTAPAVTSKLVATEVCTLVEVISLIEVTTSAMVSTCIEITSVAEASTTSARYVSWYTSADSWVMLVM